MNRNLAPVDRGIRMAVGLGIISLVFIERTWLGIIGFVPLITAFFGHCPCYAWAGRRFGTQGASRLLE